MVKLEIFNKLLKQCQNQEMDSYPVLLDSLLIGVENLKGKWLPIKEHSNAYSIILKNKFITIFGLHKNQFVYKHFEINKPAKPFYFPEVEKFLKEKEKEQQLDPASTWHNLHYYNVKFINEREITVHFQHNCNYGGNGIRYTIPIFWNKYIVKPNSLREFLKDYTHYNDVQYYYR